MTQNQIAHARLLEERRHNYASEWLTKDSNEIAALNAGVNWKNAETNLLKAQTEQQNAVLRGQELYETVRHNYAQEQVSLLKTQEEARANQASEALRYQQNVETARSNQRYEQLEASKQAETATHNRNAEQLEGSGQRASILGGLINTVGNIVSKFVR